MITQKLIALGFYKARDMYDNLIKNNRLTPDERRKNARKAGKASGKARRERKELKKELLLLLKSGDIQEKICTALIEKAQSGDVKAFEVIRDTIGEKPVDKLARTDSEGNDLDVPIVSSAELLAIMERRFERIDKEKTSG